MIGRDGGDGGQDILHTGFTAYYNSDKPFATLMQKITPQGTDIKTPSGQKKEIIKYLLNSGQMLTKYYII